MRRFARNLWKSLAGPRTTRRSVTRRRLELEALETRAVPAALATLTAFAYVDANHNGVFDAGEAALPLIPVTLSGTTTAGKAFSQTFTSNINGVVTFLELQPGTYTVSFHGLSNYVGSGVVSGIKVAAGQNARVNVGFQGLAPTAINLNEFLNTATPDVFRFEKPIVTSAISNVSLASTTASQTIDLAGHFSATDITASQIRMDTTFGPMYEALFDAATPQTVTNFYDYINTGRFDSSIFHRLVTPSSGQGIAVLQGGGFNFKTTKSGGALTSIANSAIDPNVTGAAGEVKEPNATGTLAMANSTGPSSANSQFYFNLENDTAALGPSNNGGFTVFGTILGANDQAVLNTLSTPSATTTLAVTDESNGSASSPFKTVPMLHGYPANDTHFPTDATASNFDMVNAVHVVNRPEFLRYSAVSSNPAVATVSFNPLHPEQLTVKGVSAGTATVTVVAFDVLGGSVSQTFTVTVP